MEKGCSQSVLPKAITALPPLELQSPYRSNLRGGPTVRIDRRSTGVFTSEPIAGFDGFTPGSPTGNGSSEDIGGLTDDFGTPAERTESLSKRTDPPAAVVAGATASGVELSVLIPGSTVCEVGTAAVR